MGKRFWLGIALLVLFLGAGLGISAGMHRLHAPAAAQLQEAVRLALDGDFRKAAGLADQAYNRWEKYRKLTAAVADHAPMDDVDTLFAEMQVYAQAEEIPHFAACCGQLSRLVLAMAQAHSPTWWNFL